MLASSTLIRQAKDPGIHVATVFVLVGAIESVLAALAELPVLSDVHSCTLHISSDPDDGALRLVPRVFPRLDLPCLGCQPRG